jgi:hypothetical protein
MRRNCWRSITTRPGTAGALRGWRRICLLAPAALPPPIGHQTVMRRPAARPEWRFDASCLVKRPAAGWHAKGAVLAVPQNPGAATIEFSLTGGQDRDAGSRSSWRRRAQEASRCES